MDVFRAPKQLQPTDWEGRRKKPGELPFSFQKKENVPFRTAWEENGHVAQSTPEERRAASFWDKASLVKRLEAFFFLKRTHCPALPVVADSALHVSLRSATPRATPTKQVKPPRSYRDFAPTPPPVKKVPQAITIVCPELSVLSGKYELQPDKNGGRPVWGVEDNRLYRTANQTWGITDKPADRSKNEWLHNVALVRSKTFADAAAAAAARAAEAKAAAEKARAEAAADPADPALLRSAK